MALIDEILALGMPLDDHGAIAAALSVGRTKLGSVTTDEFTMWAAPRVRAVIEDQATNPVAPMRASALALRDFLGGAAPALNLAHPGNAALLTAWQSANLITQAEHDALIAAATKPDVITSQDVTKALEGYQT